MMKNHAAGPGRNNAKPSPASSSTHAPSTYDQDFEKLVVSEKRVVEWDAGGPLFSSFSVLSHGHQHDEQKALDPDFATLQSPGVSLPPNFLRTKP